MIYLFISRNDASGSHINYTIAFSDVGCWRRMNRTGVACSAVEYWYGWGHTKSRKQDC
jgi:hypothetical protein